MVGLVCRPGAGLLSGRCSLRLAVLLHRVMKPITLSGRMDKLLDTVAERHCFLVDHEHDAMDRLRHIHAAVVATNDCHRAYLGDMNRRASITFDRITQKEGPRRAIEKIAERMPLASMYRHELSI